MQAINNRLTIALEHLPIPGREGETVAAYVIYENIPGARRIVGAMAADDCQAASSSGQTLAAAA